MREPRGKILLETIKSQKSSQVVPSANGWKWKTLKPRALLKKNREQSEKAIVSVYEVPDDILDREYPVLRFMGATKEWLEFVVNNRRGRENGDYDLIMGPVANDQLYATIRLYEQRVVTAEAAIEMLKAHKLFNQLSFHTVTVALLLKFVESIEVG